MNRVLMIIAVCGSIVFVLRMLAGCAADTGASDTGASCAYDPMKHYDISVEQQICEVDDCTRYNTDIKHMITGPDHDTCSDSCSGDAYTIVCPFDTYRFQIVDVVDGDYLMRMQLDSNPGVEGVLFRVHERD